MKFCIITYKAIKRFNGKLIIALKRKLKKAYHKNIKDHIILGRLYDDAYKKL